jgi:hypothetical protein
MWFQKISIPSPRMVIGNSEGYHRGSRKPKCLRESMEQHWKFQQRWEVHNQIPSLGEAWMFSGTTHLQVVVLYNQHTKLHNEVQTEV